jgi:hypothetical protein
MNYLTRGLHFGLKTIQKRDGYWLFPQKIGVNIIEIFQWLHIPVQRNYHIGIFWNKFCILFVKNNYVGKKEIAKVKEKHEWGYLADTTAAVTKMKHK